MKISIKRPNIPVLFLLLFLTIHPKGIAQVSGGRISAEACKAIAENNKIYFEAFEKNDSTLFINRYTYDCWIMAPDAPTFCGVDAPLSFYQIAYGVLGLRTGKKTTISLFGTSNGMIAEAGIFEYLDANKKSIVAGKYLVLWKKTSAGWKIFRDSFNGDGKY
jgi:ketosteroid isomerase-like protein